MSAGNPFESTEVYAREDTPKSLSREQPEALEPVPPIPPGGCFASTGVVAQHHEMLRQILQNQERQLLKQEEMDARLDRIERREARMGVAVNLHSKIIYGIAAAVGISLLGALGTALIWTLQQMGKGPT